MTPTSFTGASQVAGSRAVTHIAVPALPADPIVQAGVADALLGCFLGAGGFDPRGLLRLSHAPHVLALAIDEQVPHAAHKAVVQQSCPNFSGEHQASLVLGKASQIEVVIQVQDLALSWGLVGGPDGVH